MSNIPLYQRVWCQIRRLFNKFDVKYFAYLMQRV
jgi:hypothetical protein